MLEHTPPMRNGVSPSRVYLPAHQTHTTIFAFLCDYFPHIHKQEWQERIQDQLVIDQNLQPITINTTYKQNTFIFYYRFLAHEFHVPYTHHHLFENDDLLVVDKPHFLTMSPTGQYLQETLLVRLKHETQNALLTPIHRLDRETAGVVMFSKRPETRAIYQQLFSEKKVFKQYHAIAKYNTDLVLPKTTQYHMQKGDPFYTMQIIAHEPPNSETYIECLEHNKIWAKYLLRPTTGKQHQLRVHLNALGIPIMNDPYYPRLKHKAPDDFSQPLQLLAKQLSFHDPITEEDFAFFSRQELQMPS
ncbi:pseudouridine synthase [Acinetobacter pollinis]|jgi:tRNA pseudouridine32 synthase / 23S rRNA pseudouridine746 synthase|nr:pseudouridine synthase [Acinetobacter pollinis]